MQEEHIDFHSHILGKSLDLLITGHWGYPILMFPTSMGTAFQNRDSGLLKSIEPLLNNPPIGKKVDALTIRNNIAASIGRSGDFAEATARLEKVIADGEALLGDQAEIPLRHRWFAGEFLRLQSRFRECATDRCHRNCRVPGQLHQ